MSSARPDEVLRLVREFVERIDPLDPEAPTVGDLELRWRGETVRLAIRLPVAQALAEALAAFHDPRDHGTCDHCRTGRLDRDLRCRNCGIVNGVFGRTIADFVARDQRTEELPAG